MLYLVGAFLLFILILLVIVFFVFKKSKPETCEINPQPTKKILSLQDYIALLKTEKSDKDIFTGMLDSVVRKYPFPGNEKEAKTHFEFVYYYAKNPMTTAKMIVEMQQKLAKANPKYAKQIEQFQMQGVEARKKK